MRNIAGILIAAMVGCGYLQGQTYFVQTFAGGGGFGFIDPTCFPGPICGPDFSSVVLDGEGNLFVSLPKSNLVARLDTFGGFNLMAGSGAPGDGGDSGPAVLTSLYPGLTTPAVSGETISLFATGFGLPTTTVSSGSASQSGPLPNPLPICTVGKSLAQVTVADLISPGLYQLNVVIPASTPSGDNPVVCAFAGINLPFGLIANQ